MLSAVLSSWQQKTPNLRPQAATAGVTPTPRTTVALGEIEQRNIPQIEGI
jgi:hypothetical protein